jgi:glyoxylase-like metal-dependent hydrolase (beta-lactamase superfamily II)
MPFKRIVSILSVAVLLGSAALASAADAPLKLEVYNAGDKSLFSVASVLVEGKHDAVLVDAQFGRAEAEELAQKVRASGKTLKTIYVSHGDPDYYFGLDTLHKAFPQAQILATKPTVDHILATQALKLAYWGPILKDNAPAEVVVPQVLQGDRIDLEGNVLQVVGLDGPTPDRSFVWIPSIKAVIGGIPVVAGLHVWMADTQTPESHAQWLATLDRIAKLKPTTVVPGHFAPGSAQTPAAVDFTRDYIRAYDSEAAKAKNSTQLVTAMKQRYPNLGAVSSLELSAKVSKGEMKWP